jgi:hypothetical protein
VTDDAQKLSPVGQARRDAMLGELTDYMRHVHGARRMRRRVGAACGVVAVVFSLAVLALSGTWSPKVAPGGGDLPLARSGHDGPEMKSSTDGDAPTPRGSAGCDIRIVQTDPAVLERYRARPAARVILLDDRELLATLAAMNRPTGLIRYQGRAWLTANVTDAELGHPQ